MCEQASNNIVVDTIIRLDLPFQDSLDVLVSGVFRLCGILVNQIKKLLEINQMSIGVISVADIVFVGSPDQKKEVEVLLNYRIHDGLLFNLDLILEDYDPSKFAFVHFDSEIKDLRHDFNLFCLEDLF